MKKETTFQSKQREQLNKADEKMKHAEMKKRERKNCMIYYYNLWFGFAFECVTSAYMCGLMKTIVIWTRPITFNCIFTFHTTNRQSCYFHKKIKLFHSKRSTILCMAKIQNVEFKQKNAYGKCTRFSFNLQLKFHSSSHYCLPSFYLYSISFTSHTTHLVFPFFTANE